MKVPAVALLAWVVTSLVGCGGSPPHPADAPTESGSGLGVPGSPQDSAAAKDLAPASAHDEAPQPPMALPTACAPGDADACMPGVAVADRICAASRPDAALALFAKGSPWTRLYLRGDVDGWNAEGGASTRAELVFDEEVIALKRRAPPSGGAAIVVGASGGYQVMRWDGNCYSLDEGEVTRRRPPRAKHPSIPWKYLTEKTKNALLDVSAIKAALDKRGKECRGVTIGDVPLSCEQADTAFSDAIVSAVKSGVPLPATEL